MDQQQDDFGEFRTYLDGLPEGDRAAALKQLEEHSLNEIRTALKSYYAPQGKPPAAPAQPDYNSQDYKDFAARRGAEIKGQGLSPQEERAALDELYMEYKPGMGAKPPAPQQARPFDDGEDDIPVTPKRVGGPGHGRMPNDPKMDHGYNTEPAYTEGLGGPRGNMTGKPYPTEEEYGGGDMYYGKLHAWSRDNSMPKEFRYKSPQYNQFVEEYEKRQGRGRPNDLVGAEEWYARNGDDLDMGVGEDDTPDGYVDENDPDQPAYTSPLPKGSMRGQPYPDPEVHGMTDAVLSSLYRWEKDNGAFGLEFGSPEYQEFVRNYEAQNSAGQAPAAAAAGRAGANLHQRDWELKNTPKKSMMGR